MTARTALGNSINIPAVKTLEYVSVPSAVDLATHMGITTWAPDSGKTLGLSLTLGVALARRDPGLMNERLSPPIQKNQTAADKVLLSVLRFFLARRLNDFPVVVEEAQRLLALMKTADAVTPMPGLVAPLLVFTALYMFLGVVVLVLLRAHVLAPLPAALKE